MGWWRSFDGVYLLVAVVMFFFSVAFFPFSFLNFALDFCQNAPEKEN
jgi:hypothetical protein